MATGETLSVNTPIDGERSLEFLRSQGVPETSIDQAASDGSLPFLVLEALFAPGPRQYNTSQLADRVGQPIEVVVRVRRALGFPDADPDDIVGGDADVNAIRRLMAGSPGKNLSVALERVRTSAGAMVALAESVAVAFSEGIGPMLDNGADPLVVADAALEENTPAQIMEMFIHVLRHELSGAIRRERNRRTKSPGTHELAVGFVDLVGSTQTMEELDDHQLAKLVRAYEAAAYDEIARHGGRVVKMLGDGVIFTTDQVDTALDIALSLVTKAGRGGIPLARGGLAWGTVIRAHGDVYGPTVNRAARLCDAATTSSVLLDAAAALAVDPDRVDRVGTISLKGIGSVEAYRALR